MRTKEEYYQAIKKYRAIINNPENKKCPCPKIRCEWHGKCEDCVTLHRYNKDHLPNCLQFLLKEKFIELIKTVELEATEKEKTPFEYWDYVKEQDKKNKLKEGDEC